MLPIRVNAAMHTTFAEHWLIRDLSPTAALSLYDLGELIEVGTDEVLIEADAPNDAVYLILEGAFKVYLPSRPDRVIGTTLAHRGRGDLIGEYSFVDSFSPAARITAATPGLVLRIAHDALREFLAANAEISSAVYENMLGYLVQRLRAQDEEIDSLMF